MGPQSILQRGRCSEKKQRATRRCCDCRPRLESVALWRWPMVLLRTTTLNYDRGCHYARGLIQKPSAQYSVILTCRLSIIFSFSWQPTYKRVVSQHSPAFRFITDITTPGHELSQLDAGRSIKPSCRCACIMERFQTINCQMELHHCM